MQDWDDITLLRQYVERGSEEAFAALVTRHVNKVYSVALRHTRNPHSAEEITQAVFVILATKCRNLKKGVILSGWLYQTARLTAMTYIRGEIRRARREQEARMQQSLNETEAENWTKIAPLLDAAMAGLNETDRHAVVLRFFDGKSLKEVGAALGGSEDSAKMRVSRAVEKLRRFFTKRGVAVPTAVLTAAMVANSVHAAPATLAKTATDVALAKGAAASASTLTLIQGALKVTAWTNFKTTAMVGAITVLAAGTTATLIAQHERQAGASIDLPKSSWVFAGYGSPEATLQTTLWAIGQLKGKAILDGLSADCQEDFREYVAQHKPGMSVNAFLLQMWAPPEGGYSDMRLEKEEVISTNEVLFQYLIHAGNQSRTGWFKFIKFDDDWKIDDFDPKGPHGRTGLAHANAQYGGIGVALDLESATHAPRIAKVLPALAMTQTNLVPGLILQKINGISTAGKSLSQCVFLTRGRVGTEVALELYDPESKQTNIMELTRKRFSWQDMVTLGLR